MLSIRSQCTSLLLASLTCSLLSAQQPRTQTLRTTSRIVYVDVVVRDGTGRIVHGLPQTTFDLSENKTKQRISLFEEHTAADRRVAASTAAPQQYTNTPAGAAGGPLNLVLFDLLNTAPLDQSYARTRMIAFLRAMPPGRQVALFVLSDRLHMVQGFTGDSGLLAQAAESINLKQLNRLRSPNQVIADNDATAYVDFARGGQGGSGTWGEAGPSGPSLAAAIQSALGGEDIQNMKVRLDSTNAAFVELARAVNGFPGRKNLFWLAGQFPSSTYFSLQAISPTTVNVGPPTVGGEGTTNASNLASSSGLALRTLSEKADRAVADSQIAVYPISTVGVQTDSIGAENSGIGSAGDATAKTAFTYFNERQNGRSVMDHLADETGGEAFYGNNDAGALLKRGFEDGENFYTLAYQPTDRNWDSHYRTISVALSTRGYHLSYRRGYYALPEQPTGNAMHQFAAAMRIESPPSTMLLLRATAPTASAGIAQIDTTLDLHGIGFTTTDAAPSPAPDTAASTASNTATGPANDTTEPERKATLQVLLIAYPRNGSGKPAEINSALKLNLTPDDYSKLLVTGLPLHQTIHLQPGDYALRIGIVDSNNGRIGTLTMPYTMP